MGEGGRANFSRGGAKLLLNFFPFFAIPQEMVTPTIVAFNPLGASPLGLLSTRARAALAFLWLLFLDDLDHLNGPPKRTPFDLL